MGMYSIEKVDSALAKARGLANEYSKPIENLKLDLMKAFFWLLYAYVIDRIRKGI